MWTFGANVQTLDETGRTLSYIHTQPLIIAHRKSNKQVCFRRMLAEVSLDSWPFQQIQIRGREPFVEISQAALCSGRNMARSSVADPCFHICSKCKSLNSNARHEDGLRRERILTLRHHCNVRSVAYVLIVCVCVFFPPQLSHPGLRWQRSRQREVRQTPQVRTAPHVLYTDDERFRRCLVSTSKKLWMEGANSFPPDVTDVCPAPFYFATFCMKS